jgi:hypothetical protein
MGTIMTAQNDLYILNEAPLDLKEALAEFKRRCVLIIKNVFSRGVDVQRDFGIWFDKWVGLTQDIVLILHDEPLYVVAGYLGLDPNNPAKDILDRADKLVTTEDW